MFTRSAASDTLQGQAIHSINVKWGDPDPLQRTGRESIGFPVCKKKYAPFRFPIVWNETANTMTDTTTDTTTKSTATTTASKSSLATMDTKGTGAAGMEHRIHEICHLCTDDTNTTNGGDNHHDNPRNPNDNKQARRTQSPYPLVQVERLFGCRIHHPLRRAVVQKYGEREGWEPFGQWSLTKAKELAKQETLSLRTMNHDRKPMGTTMTTAGINSNKNQHISPGIIPKASIARRSKLKPLSSSSSSLSTTTSSAFTSSTAAAAVASNSSATCQMIFTNGVTKNTNRNNITDYGQDDRETSDDDDDDNDTKCKSRPPFKGTKTTTMTTKTLGSQKTALLCQACIWKVKSAYEDVFYELNGYKESDVERTAATCTTIHQR